MMKVLITGGTGLVGRAISKSLLESGYQVAILSRNIERSGIMAFKWDFESKYIDPEAIEFADVIINLAGENISAKNWDPGQKKIIQESRLHSVSMLAQSIAKAKNKPNHFISASAIGYYGSVTSDKIFVESDPPGNDFLANTVAAWESQMDSIQNLGVKIQKIRMGVVLSGDGGALRKMQLPVKFGLGSALGSGKQWMPWISLDDLVSVFKFVIENDLTYDVYNAIAPQHVNNKQFMAELSKQMQRPFFMPGIPAGILRLVFGEMSTVILEGSRISSERILKEGFNFKHKTLQSGLMSVYS